MSRADADLSLVKLINSILPEFHLLMGRLHHDHFLTPSDSELMRETKKVLEDAAGRLMVRVEQSK